MGHPAGRGYEIQSSTGGLLDFLPREKPHLSDDEAVAKMGHPSCGSPRFAGDKVRLGAKRIAILIVVSYIGTHAE